MYSEFHRLYIWIFNVVHDGILGFVNLIFSIYRYKCFKVIWKYKCLNLLNAYSPGAPEADFCKNCILPH